MVSLKFGLGTQVIHHESVAYDHDCGDVQPGDKFSKDPLKITCKRCKANQENTKLEQIEDTQEGQNNGN